MPPADNAACLSSSSRWTVRKTTAAFEPDLRKRDATSSPVIPGMEISSTITSGYSVPAALSAEGPSEAIPITSQAGVRTAAARASIASLSSTSSTRTRSDNVAFDGILNQLRRRGDVESLHQMKRLNVTSTAELIQYTVKRHIV